MMTILTENDGYRQPQIYEVQPGITVLTSWKDIAHYFSKGVRTVQRWEKELGLPIRRPNHTSKSTVLAVITEVNDWVRSQQLSDGRADENELDRSALLEHIEALQAEIFELRRQLQMDCAKTA
jgi:hypothetical protein